MQTFTDDQQMLINTCKEAGYGWAKFAASVESQGQCSPKQESTLLKMALKIHNANLRVLKANYSLARAQYASHSHSGYDNISDNEAMRSGDYF